MKTREVIPIGAQVKIDWVDWSITGRVTAIFLRETHESYEVTWWYEGQRFCDVLEPWEIQTEPEDIEKLRVSCVL